MTSYNRRQRLMTFRVSEEEYSEIEEMSRVSRSQCISDFARNTLLSRVRAMSGRSGRLAEDLSTLSSQLSDLDSELVVLHSKINRILGSVKTVG